MARLRAIGAELVGEVVQYEDQYKLCYLRGPAGIIVAFILGFIGGMIHLPIIGRLYSLAVLVPSIAVGVRRNTKRPRCARQRGRFNEVPAMAYSPASSRTEYHRRCRA